MARTTKGASAPFLPESREEALDPGWLTAALALGYPGLAIRSVTVLGEVSRVSTNIRFSVGLERPVPGFPNSLCLKGYFTENGKLYRPAGVTEALFYRDLAASVPIRTLRCLYAEVDHKSSNSVVITEDVVPLGASFLDGLSPYTPDQVAESVSQLADLHAYGWSRPDLAQTTWLEPRLSSYLIFRGLKEVLFNFEGSIGADVPREVADAHRLVEAYRSLSDQIHKDTPWTVVHGDPHVGNLYLDGVLQPCLLDWQLSQRAPSYLDVGYHISSSLTVADRRKAERDLFALYRQRLLAQGVDPPEWAISWDGYRRGVLHGFYLWAITLAVDPAITKELLTRLGTAAADHDAYGSVP
jgi:phosphotransferase family enzyme